MSNHLHLHSSSSYKWDPSNYQLLYLLRLYYKILPFTIFIEILCYIYYASFYNIHIYIPYMLWIVFFSLLLVFLYIPECIVTYFAYQDQYACISASVYHVCIVHFTFDHCSYCSSWASVFRQRCLVVVATWYAIYKL